MTSRLDSVDRDLRRLLQRVSTRQQRAAAMAASVHVVLVSRLSGDHVEAAMRAVRDRRADPELSKALADQCAALDEQAFLLRERADSHPETNTAMEHDDESADGWSLEVAYEEVFARARAAAALSWALDVDSERAAVESVYEAHAAIGHMAALRHLVEHAMSVPAWR